MAGALTRSARRFSVARRPSGVAALAFAAAALFHLCQAAQHVGRDQAHLRGSEDAATHAALERGGGGRGVAEADAEASAVEAAAQRLLRGGAAVQKEPAAASPTGEAFAVDNGDPQEEADAEADTEAKEGGDGGGNGDAAVSEEAAAAGDVVGAKTASEYSEVHQAVQDQMSQTDNIDIPESMVDDDPKVAGPSAADAADVGVHGAGAAPQPSHPSQQAPAPRAPSAPAPASEYEAVHDAVRKQMHATDNVGEGVAPAPALASEAAAPEDSYEAVNDAVAEQMRETDNVGEGGDDDEGLAEELGETDGAGEEEKGIDDATGFSTDATYPEWGTTHGANIAGAPVRRNRSRAADAAV